MKHVRGILAYSEFCQKRQLAFDFPIYTIHSYLHFLAFLTNCVPVALQIPLKDAVLFIPYPVEALNLIWTISP